MTDEPLRAGIRLVNVVSTAEVAQLVDISSFNRYEHLASDLDLYRCGYVKDGGMTGRVTVFANGKMISVGTKSREQSFREIRRAVAIMRGHRLIKPRRVSPLVRNMVATADRGAPVDIEGLARRLPRSLYEPEQFPGLIHRIQGSVVALIFASGKMNIVGARSCSEINSAYFDVCGRIAS